MNENKFTNRHVDKVSVEKSKEHLWKYIQSKVKAKETAKKESNFFSSLKSIFTMPKKLIPVGAVAFVLIAAVLAYNLNFSLPWVSVPTVYASFEMEATKEDSSGVDSDTSFTLTSSEDLSEKVIAQNLEVSPEVELKIQKIGDKEYEVTPNDSLESNKIYTFSIKTANDDYDWAYQVKDTFKITGVLPADKSTYVPVDSGIEIYFSHENYDYKNIEKYFEISPKAEGSFEYHYRTLSFVPDAVLQDGTLYTVTLKSGLPLIDSDQKLTEDYKFQFETASDSANKTAFEFTNIFNEVAPGQTIAIGAYNYKSPFLEEIDINGNKVEQETTPVVDFELYQFKNVDQYTDVLKEKAKVPSWAYFASRDYRVDVGSLNFIGDLEAKYEKIDWSGYFYFPTATLDEGFYLFQVKDDAVASQIFVQVTNIASYLDITKTDTLVWINDLTSGSSVKNAKVTLVESGDSYNTNDEGIAVFKTPETWKTDSYYGDVSSRIIKITSPDGKSLVQYISAYYSEYVPPEYWKIFTTDRSMYKSNDTIKFWGFLEPRTDSAKTDDLKIKLVKDYNTTVKEFPLKLNNDNTFSGEIDLDTVSAGSYYSLTLSNGEKTIATQYLDIKDYVKPAYKLKLIPDKNAVFAGESVNFDVESNFYEGTPVPNLDLAYYLDWSGNASEKLKTDVNGKTSFNLDTYKVGCDDDYYCGNVRDLYVEIKPTLAEESDILDSTSIRVFNSKLDLQSTSKIEDDVGKLDITTTWVDLSKMNDGDVKYYDDYLGDPAENRVVNSTINSFHWEKTEVGQYYDFINKKTVKKYEYHEVKDGSTTFSINTDKDGKATYEFNADPNKYYKIKLTVADDEGNIAYDSNWIYGSAGSYGYSNYDYYTVKVLNGGEDQYKPEFDIGDTVKTGFANQDELLAPDTKGKFLFLKHSNGLKEYDLTDSPSYNFEFKKDYSPTIFVSGVWFDGKTYKLAYAATAYYKSSLKELTVKVSTDKESYEPGEKVTLDVKTTDKNNKAISADVNLNLVDEAFYKLVYDQLENPLADLYYSTDQGVLIESNSHISPMTANSERDGKGGCFAAGTKILMSDFTYKTIENIKPGDFVLTKESYMSPIMVKSKVLSTISHDLNEYILINENLKVTKEHVIFMNGHWDLAGNVKVGDVLLNKNNEEVTITSVRTVSGPVKVYNFEVEGQHTYFANDFYVHNDKGGDGVRNDFEDNALFQTIQTDANGSGTVTFQLPDNITSWRVTAKAIETNNLMAGVGISNINVSLPIFADLTMNQEYSVKDSPVVKLRAYGNALKEGDVVKFIVTAASLGLEKSDTINGEAFLGSYFNLPKLTLGTHNVKLAATSGKYEDALEKPMNVVDSRLNETVVTPLEDAKNVEGVKTHIEASKDHSMKITFVDGGIGFYYCKLISLYYSFGDRLDQRLSKVAASELLNTYFNETFPNAKTLLVQNYQNAGLKLLPYGSEDLKLTALALTMDTDTSKYDNVALKDYLYKFYKDKNSNLEDVVLSLLGLSALDEPVLTSLRTIQNDENITIEQKLYIGLAFENLGSKIDALKIYKELGADFKKDSSNYQIALRAVLAAALGLRDEADKIWEFVEENGIPDDIINLYEIGYLKNSLKHADPVSAKFEVVYGDAEESSKKTVELKPYETFSLEVSPGEYADLSVIDGAVSYFTSYKVDVTPEQFSSKTDERVGVTRRYYVDGVETSTFKEGDLVKVVLDMRANSDVKDYSFAVTDILPSGLTVVSRPYRYFYNYNYGTENDEIYSYPYQVNKQEVNFYWYKGEYSTKSIVYYARVVTPGEYYADPAKIESFTHPEIVNISDENTVKIDPVTK